MISIDFPPINLSYWISALRGISTSKNKRPLSILSSINGDLIKLSFLLSIQIITGFQGLPKLWSWQLRRHSSYLHQKLQGQKSLFIQFILDKLSLAQCLRISRTLTIPETLRACSIIGDGHRAGVREVPSLDIQSDQWSSSLWWTDQSYHSHTTIIRLSQYFPLLCNWYSPFLWSSLTYRDNVISLTNKPLLTYKG